MLSKLLFRKNRKPSTVEDVQMRLDSRTSHSKRRQIKYPLFDQNPYFYDGDYREDFKINDVKKSAKKGCGQCKLLLSALSAYESQWVSQLSLPSTSNFKISLESARFSSLPSLSSYSDPSKPVRIHIQEACPDRKQEQRSIFRFEFFTANGPSESRFVDSLAIATQWLNECLDSHERCAVPKSKFMPSRIIDVVGIAYRVPSDPCLIDSTIEPAPYVALSYCWGTTSNILTTTRENIAEHCNSIPLLSLPQTLQDAVVVCRKMDIRYLWIDAICIIQNDINERDWYTESGRMRHIYSNATFVIAADCSVECTDGFLGKQVYEHKWRQFENSVKGNTDLSGFAREALHHSDPAGLIEPPLSRRGWVLQESILPNRILHFTKEEMVWECNTHCRCECAGTPNYDRILRPVVGVIKGNCTKPVADLQDDGHDRSSVHINNFLSSITAESISWAWENLIELYTTRQLSNNADKLTAMSGLAQIAMHSLGVSADSYLAGLWRFGLAEGLLWHLRGPIEPRRYTTYYAPSWSWASIHGSIKYFTTRYQFHFVAQIEIIEAECTGSTLDPTGRATAGYLLLSGIMIPVSLVVKNSKLDSTTSSTMYTSLNDRAIQTHKGQLVYVRVFDIKFEVLMDERVPLEQKDISYYCLRIGTTRGRGMESGRGMRSIWVRLWFLVIRSTEEGTFERAGIGYQSLSLEDPDLFDFPSAQTQTIRLV